MSDPLIFVLGLFVAIITVTAAVLIGVSEGRDPAHSGVGKDVRLRTEPVAPDVPVATDGGQVT